MPLRSSITVNQKLRDHIYTAASSYGIPNGDYRIFLDAEPTLFDDITSYSVTFMDVHTLVYYSRNGETTDERPSIYLGTFRKR